MEQEIKQNIQTKIQNNTKTYITLAEIEEMIDKKIEYTELVNIIKNFVNDGILQAVRKRQKW